MSDEKYIVKRGEKELKTSLKNLDICELNQDIFEGKNYFSWLEGYVLDVVIEDFHWIFIIGVIKRMQKLGLKVKYFDVNRNEVGINSMCKLS